MGKDKNVGIFTMTLSFSSQYLLDHVIRAEATSGETQIRKRSLIVPPLLFFSGEIQ